MPVFKGRKEPNVFVLLQMIDVNWQACRKRFAGLKCTTFPEKLGYIVKCAWPEHSLLKNPSTFVQLRMRNCRAVEIALKIAIALLAAPLIFT
jgi:hypothetical protein